MGDVIGYTSSSGIDRPARSAVAGARSTAAQEFDGATHEWNDLPEQTQAADDGNGTLVAEVAHRPSEYAVTIDGRPHQVTVAFRAYLDRLVVAQAVRPLNRRENGTLAPAGAWRHHEATIHRPVTNPVRTRGKVPPGTPTASDDAPSSHARPPARHRAGAHAFGYLPAPVRATAIAAVPEPSTWLGQIVQWSRNDSPVRQRVSNVRLSHERAVAVTAERGDGVTERTPEQMAALPWEVVQVSYDLAEPAQQIGSQSRQGRRDRIGGGR